MPAKLAPDHRPPDHRPSFRGRPSADGKFLERRLFYPRQVIFREGDQGDYAYLIQSGEVALVKDTGLRPMKLATVGANALFGELALIDGGRRMATAVACSPVTCVLIGKERLRQMLAQLDPIMCGHFTFMLGYVRDTLPLEERRKEGDPVFETSWDVQARLHLANWAELDARHYPNALARALDEMLCAYARRRLPKA